MLSIPKAWRTIYADRTIDDNKKVKCYDNRITELNNILGNIMINTITNKTMEPIYDTSENIEIPFFKDFSITDCYKFYHSIMTLGEMLKICSSSGYKYKILLEWENLFLFKISESEVPITDSDPYIEFYMLIEVTNADISSASYSEAKEEISERKIIRQISVFDDDEIKKYLLSLNNQIDFVLEKLR